MRHASSEYYFLTDVLTDLFATHRVEAERAFGVLAQNKKITQLAFEGERLLVEIQKLAMATGHISPKNQGMRFLYILGRGFGIYHTLP